MDRAFVIGSAAEVRAAIARVVLHSQPRGDALGSIRLKPHQVSAIPRLESALAELGGALLCDEVGVGKTYIALAIARCYARVLVVAPAGLREMWRDATTRAGVQAGFTTVEKLSRDEAPSARPDLLIIDEAHHARNPRTRRYKAIARLARDARVLLLTATPIHNRRTDLVSLLSLFLGSRAKSLTEHELSRCIVRREQSESAAIGGIPRVDPVVACDLPDDPNLVARLMGLPPPLPPRDGDSGGALINRGLIHQWSSSDAALRDAVRRRLAKAEALIASLRVGRYPDARELESWTYSDGALQLGFAELLAPPTLEPDTLLRSVSSHGRALESFRHDYAQSSSIDDAKAAMLHRIREENAGVKIVAFAQYSSTVSALFGRLARVGGIAALTASGARVAGGRLSRNEAIARFAPRSNRARPPSRAEAIDLLLTTDLLSEGVNLQDAGIVVHLDIPWTAARMEQRVGRVARMGSLHRRIRVYQFRPPASAEIVLREEALVSRKWAIARHEVGAIRVSPFASEDNPAWPTQSIPFRNERLRAILGRWLETDPGVRQREGRILAGAVSSVRSGFIAAGYFGRAPLLLCSTESGVSTDLDAQTETCLAAEGKRTDADREEYEAASLLVQKWSEYAEASDSAGAASMSAGSNRRLLNRIDATLQNSPPHVRASRARMASAARALAGARTGVAVESELRELADAPMRDDEWLETLAGIAATRNARDRGSTSFHLRALLLLKP